MVQLKMSVGQIMAMHSMKMKHIIVVKRATTQTIAAAMLSGR